MKKIILLPLLALLVLNSNFSFGQTCSIIIRSSFRIVSDPQNSCLRHITFDYYNENNGAARITVEIGQNNVSLLSDCFDAAGPAGPTYTYTSGNFTACSLTGLFISLTPRSGNTCSSSPCAPTLISIAGGALPVTFTSFTVGRNKEMVSLKWSTSTEINNKGFIIEKNTNGTWSEIGYEASQAIDGNSSSLLNYNYTDINSAKGMTQYRIKQVDMDGHSKYSEVRAIQGLTQDSKTTVFPNPSNDGKVNIVFDAAARRDITIVDIAGRTIRQVRSFTGNSMQVSGLNPGLYTVRSNNTESGEVTINKVMIAAN